MSEKKPNEAERDTSRDSEEPAFEWMKGSAQAGGQGPETEGGAPEGAEPATSGAAAASAGHPEPAAEAGAHETVEGTRGGDGPRHTTGDDGEAAAAREGTAEESPAREAEGEAAGPAVEHVATAEGETLEQPTELQERLPTSALTLRGPEDEVQRRQAARDAALAAKPVGPRVVKVLSAIFLPLLLVIAAVRVVATPLFLWLEYIRPGFPGDGYGFSQEDRITYGSYAVDYLSNFAGPRYLGDLVTASGAKLFRDPEISHMADVKTVTMATWGVGAVLAVLAIIAIWYLGSRKDGSLRHAFFSASIVTLVVVIGLGVLGFLGWDSFFTGFHELFFANGTWTFSLQDTLIRLFPGQFWMDAAVVIAALVFLTSLVTLIVTWPTKRRRELRKAVIAERLAAQQAAVAGE